MGNIYYDEWGEWPELKYFPKCKVKAKRWWSLKDHRSARLLTKLVNSDTFKKSFITTQSGPNPFFNKPTPTREEEIMNLVEHFSKEKTVNGVLVAFMEAIEEWQSEVEGSPTGDEMKELHKIYDIAEVELRYIINNDTPPTDEPAPTKEGEK